MLPPHHLAFVSGGNAQGRTIFTLGRGGLFRERAPSLISPPQDIHVPLPLVHQSEGSLSTFWNPSLPPCVSRAYSVTIGLLCVL
ncbi:hypothetical protein CDAR_419461 [Caerostris darwini]|uniref:Uncharacterized protein n=1 Tax=Caerostris darwini TaxID=1538125 RepID=A0AAV4PYR8_9ARAC|nr:hypothetical protein CDAR_419461 [Caerostris darwini]